MSSDVLDTNRDAESVIQDFERHWLSNKPPSIVAFAHNLQHDKVINADFLAELCIIDLEFRWSQESIAPAPNDELGSRPRLSDYTDILPRHGRIAFEPTHIVEEYRIRTLWGDRPTPDQFLSEQKSANPILLRLIKEIDQQLASDDAGVDHFATATRLPADDDPRAPLPFSDFTLHELIGSGGVGKVYRATQKSLQRTVAVKTLAKSLQRNPQAIDRFVDEARTLARLRHPSIVGVHGLGRYPGGGYFLVMDFINGRTLEEVARCDSLSPDDVVALVRDLAVTIDYAHSQGVIHCDLKPSNVLIAEDQRVVVTDFGFAELWQQVHASSSNRVDQRGGTFGYTAPEWLNDEAASPAPTIDIYALGAILNDLAKRQHNAHSQLIEVCELAMSLNPNDRFQSAREFLDALG